jgi:hypothetical protein
MLLQTVLIYLFNNAMARRGDSLCLILSKPHSAYNSFCHINRPFYPFFGDFVHSAPTTIGQPSLDSFAVTPL